MKEYPPLDGEVYPTKAKTATEKLPKNERYPSNPSIYERI